MAAPINEAYNVHVFNRHWSAESEIYTGGDALFSFIYAGWQVKETIFYQQIYFSGGRQTQVYYFFLKKGEAIVCMPVVSSPNVVNFVRESQFKLLAVTSLVTRYLKAQNASALEKAIPEAKPVTLAEVVPAAEEHVRVTPRRRIV